MNRAGIILAAGEGKRMKSAKPKVMHAVAGRTVLGHVIAAMREAGIGQIVVVTSANAEEVRDCAESLGVTPVIQEQQLGTGHAAACAAPALSDFSGTLLINNGDMPLITGETLQRAFTTAEKTGLAIVAFRPGDAAAYGRVICDADGYLDRIVEAKDATESERSATLCNAGTVIADAQSFFRWAAKLENSNAQGEFYLTDVPMIAKREGVRCAVMEADAIEVMGMNTRPELAHAEGQMQRRLRTKALENGVGMMAPGTVFLSFDTVLEPDVQIGPFVVFGPGVTVRSGAEIRAFSHLEGCTIERDAIVGPYARLRPGAKIGENVHIGNFVEVKNSTLEKGAKANHLTYLGDARVGAGANVGAGTITCNYDGFDKQRIDIGAGAFVGSNSALVAPVKIGDGAYVGAGSVITRDVSGEALAVTRAEQKEHAGWAAKFRARKRTGKAKKGS
ncbi:MAG TPA: bifunctional UDP-N-acetylglucosamine diphosphorylase/glucosamine-1-phosphate N-acetyltransferase GlmU [Rhizomicrobium sp.]|jgi:bifunctional UDP-N-acetylglucosamine pyrophosphorylase/glucosamine-1-phosphate N-acetyltransferase|nr:bifunctional UDP-N-acetylglucosamine diphosphorylase/glucosamine-1-phosphate N-acetyltransferase GlmU [Rhizomicrobium sp.]